MATEETIHSNLPIPPGEYLEEVLAELGMTKDELAKCMGRPATKLSAIFKGDKAITPETALQLQRVVGVPAHIWTGLETEYRLTLARLEEEQRDESLEDEVEMVPRFPYQDLVKAGELERHAKPTDKARALRDFFGVMCLKSVQELNRYRPAFRCGKSTLGERTPEALAAWLRMGERRARDVDCLPFQEDRLRMAVGDLRAMTLRPAETFQETLRSRLSECGVAAVICPHFSKTRTHGATFWLGRNKAVLMITIRGKWADVFWFSLFHEIGHILLHGQRAMILEDDRGDDREDDANSFAANALIPPTPYREFIQREAFDSKDIVAFAGKIKIHPGIIVGRLQHDGLLRPQWMNDLRSRYDWMNPARSNLRS